MISKDQLKSIMPNITSENLEAYYQPLNEVMEKYGITTPIRQAMFLAQVAHESNELKNTVENLNYSAKRLTEVFPRYFRTIEEAQPYDRQPEKIANRVYANRMGNTVPFDGWLYRGRGPFQLTGRENYTAFCAASGCPDINLVSGPAWGSESAGWFWSSRNLNTLADKGLFKAVTKRINGGYIGLEHRIEYFERAKKALGILNCKYE